MTPQERKNFEWVRDNVHSEPMTQVEAMKLALETLELAKNSHGMMLLSDPPQEAWKTYRVDDAIKKSTTALRQAIEQAQKQEPVAWALNFELFWPSEYEIISKNGDKAIPLYTTPPQRQPLTDEQIVAINDKHYNLAYRDFDADIAIARAIEAAHGIKE